MKMADTQLMYTIAQVSAAFVAIIAGFYTSRILSLSSEKQRIQNKISEIETEIDERSKTAEGYQARLDEYYQEDAEEVVKRFTSELLAEDVLSEFVFDDLLANFKKLELREPDKYERAIIEREYSSIIQKIRDELDERRPRLNPGDVLGLGGAGSFADGFGSFVRKTAYFDVFASSPEVTRHRNQIISEIREKLDNENNQVRILGALKDHHVAELKTIVMPHRIIWGYASQVAFAIFGVGIPLVYAKWPDFGGAGADLQVLLWFGAGMFTVFAYIFSEVYWALSNRQKPRREKIKNNVLAFLCTSAIKLR